MIKDYCKKFGRLVPDNSWPYKNMYDFLAREGQVFERTHKFKETGWKRGIPKNCYGNSYNLAISKIGISYCEGLAISKNVPMLPLAHAWNFRFDLDVIDSTWGDKAVQYFGVIIPSWYILQCALQTGTYGVIDSWELQWPILTGKHKWPLDKKQVKKAGWGK